MSEMEGPGTYPHPYEPLRPADGPRPGPAPGPYPGGSYQPGPPYPPGPAAAPGSTGGNPFPGGPAPSGTPGAGYSPGGINPGPPSHPGMPGLPAGQVAPIGQGTPGNSPGSAALGRLAGALLLSIAALGVPASFLPLVEFDEAFLDIRMSLTWSAWHFGGGADDTPQVIGVAITLAAVVALMGGVMLAAGGGRRAGARGIGYLAAGITLGVTLALVAALVVYVKSYDSAEMDEEFLFESTVGPGFWLLVFMAVLAAITLPILLLAHRRAIGMPRPGRAADGMTGVLLLLAAALTITGSLLDLLEKSNAWGFTGENESALTWQGPVLTLTATLSIAMAFALFSRLPVKFRQVRGLAVFVSGLAVGAPLAVVCDTESVNLSLADLLTESLGPGFWVLTVATVTAWAAAISSLAAQRELEIPATTWPPAAGQPYYPAPQQYPAHPAPQTYAAPPQTPPAPPQLIQEEPWQQTAGPEA
ncbi:hypothetical protein [Nocardia huaxiensis]|uniref:hypothetical protein n=1 Tax=Nocardia huaxiensis TaxID=2755382 RepID=UPI0023E886B5|nr:hypothetical protein [Nocardia huaxiensis]